MGIKFNAKWLLLSLALSIGLTLIVRALTGVWFLGFFLFLPFGFSFGSKSWGNMGSGQPSAPQQTAPAETFSSTPYSQDELRQSKLPGGSDRQS